MPITSFRSVLWGRGESVTDTKLNQMANNTQYLYEQMPRMIFNAHGIQKNSGIKVMAGVAVVPPSGGWWSSKRVEFGSFFTAGCRPVIVTGTQPTGPKMSDVVTIRGLNGNYVLDHRGFQATVAADYINTTVKDIIDHTIYIHYIAIGW